jgi:hypothetical protein
VDQSATPDEIRARMHEIRAHLPDDMEDIVISARQLTDWKRYVRRFPWATLGAVAAVGFLAVPRKLFIRSPDAETLAKLAKSNQLVVRQDPSPEIGRSPGRDAFKFLTNMLLRAGIAYVGQQAGKMMAAPPKTPELEEQLR